MKPKERNGGQKSEKKMAKVHDSNRQKGSGKDSMTPEAGCSERRDQLAGKAGEAPRAKQEAEAVGGLVQNLNGQLNPRRRSSRCSLRRSRLMG